MLKDNNYSEDCIEVLNYIEDFIDYEDIYNDNNFQNIQM